MGMLVAESKVNFTRKEAVARNYLQKKCSHMKTDQVSADLASLQGEGLLKAQSFAYHSLTCSLKAFPFLGFSNTTLMLFPTTCFFFVALIGPSFLYSFLGH
jgi:hypothetical protein